MIHRDLLTDSTWYPSVADAVAADKRKCGYCCGVRWMPDKYEGEWEPEADPNVIAYKWRAYWYGVTDGNRDGTTTT